MRATLTYLNENDVAVHKMFTTDLPSHEVGAIRLLADIVEFAHTHAIHHYVKVEILGKKRNY